MTGTAAAVHLCKTTGQYLPTYKVSRYCIFIFHGRVDVIGTVSIGIHYEACIGYLYIHADFKIPVFIFRGQIYIILIYLLQRPYFNIVVFK